MSLVMKRKSIRKYTDESIKKEDIQKMLQAAMQAPSATNQQPWEFVVVQKKETLESLSNVSRGAWMLAHAPLCITVLMKEGTNAPDMRPQDLGACVENILLEAVNLGLGACWIGVYPKEDRVQQVRDILQTKDLTPFANIAIGHPLQKEEVHVRFDPSRIHYETVK